MCFHWILSPLLSANLSPLSFFCFARVRKKNTRILNPEPSLLKVKPFGGVSDFSYSGFQIYIFFVSLRNFDILNFKFS